MAKPVRLPRGSRGSERGIGGQPPTALTPKMEARILAKTQQAPRDGSPHWSTRKLGRLFRIRHNLVAKAWQRACLQPHRFERYMQSDDPELETKATDVIGLYLNPPDHAAVFAVMRKRPFRRWTGWTLSCRCRRVARSGTSSSITDMARSLCSRR